MCFVSAKKQTSQIVKKKRKEQTIKTVRTKMKSLAKKKMLEVKVKIKEKAEKDHAWRGWKIQSESLERDWVAGGSRGIHEIKPRSAERERERRNRTLEREETSPFSSETVH